MSHEPLERAAKVRHDLRTPRNAVLCFAQLLEMEDLNEVQRSYVDQILSSGRDLLTMIDTVGVTAAPEAGFDTSVAPGSPAAPAASDPAAAPTVLYVEDNASNVALVEQIFTRRGDVDLVIAMTAEEGLGLARDRLPELVLLDLELPDAPGTEVLARLREDPATAAIPVVVLSADATPGRIEQVLGSGAHDYLTKPLELDRFSGVVDGLLPARRAGAP